MTAAIEPTAPAAFWTGAAARMPLPGPHRTGCGEVGCTRTDPEPCEGCQLAEMRAELEHQSAELSNSALGRQPRKEQQEMSPYETAAELSATAADIAANTAEGRGCPDLLGHARDLLDTLAAEIGDTDTDRPVPYTLTAKALAALAEVTQ
jgi:hypothetical protein